MKAKGYYAGIYSDKGSVTINGGNVEANSTNEKYSAYGIFSKKKMTISGGTVTAVGKTIGLGSDADITISGEKVTAIGGNDGINSMNGALTFSGGTVNVTGTNHYGITTKGVEISDGTVTAKGK